MSLPAALTTVDCRAVIHAMSAAVTAQAEHLSALDAAVGDGDHGVNMAAALQAASTAAQAIDGTPADLFERVGKTLMNAMGGASGILFGSFFQAGGRAIRADQVVALPALASFFDAGVAKVRQRGKASAGEKTMLDALLPAAAALQQAARAQWPLPAALHAAARAAQAGAAATADMVAQHGRARFLGDRSLGHPDAGAASTAVMLQAWADTVTALATERKANHDA